MNNKIFNGLGLAMRAGKLISGDEAVLKSVRAGEAVLVVMAVDASDNMRKKYQDKCSSFSVKLLEYCLRTEL
jgi:ribosomal protein L7Ae-like RNA K-turn-binding protein